MSNKQQRSLIRKYQKLDLAIQKIVQVLAVACEPMARTNLVSFSAKVGVRHEDGRRPIYKEDRDELNAAIDDGVLEYVSKAKTGPVTVASPIMDYVFRDAFDSGLAKSVMGQFGNESQHQSLYYRHNDQDAVFRNLRMAFYAGDLRKWTVWVERCRIRPVFLTPFTDEAFERLSPPFQSIYFLEFSRGAVDFNDQLEPKFLSCVDRFLDSFSKIPGSVVDGATDLFAAQGNLDALRDLDSRVDQRSEIKGCIAFLQGEYDTAREYFEIALKETRKRTRKGKSEFMHLPSLFYALLLLRENSPESQTKLRQVIKSGSGCGAMSDLLSDGLQFQTTPMKKNIPRICRPGEISGIAFLVSGLIWNWFYSDQNPTFSQAHFKKLAGGYHKPRFDWVAAEFNAVIAQSTNSKTASKKLSKRSADLHEQLGTVSLIDFIVPAPPWEAPLIALENLCTGASPAHSAKIASDLHSERMIWELEYSVGGPWLRLSPIIQKLGQKGWSKGRRVALSRLYEQWETSEFEFLTEQDRAICRCLNQTFQTNHYGYRETIYQWSQAKIGKVIVGHPRLYYTDDRDTPIDVMESKPYLSIGRTKQEIKLAIEPWSEGQSRFIRQEGTHRLSIVEFTDQQKMVAELVGGLSAIPVKQQDRVTQLASSISSIIDVQSGIEGTPSSGETVDASAQIIVQLTPWQEGLRAELFVQPLGENGPFCRPGTGAASVLATIDGKALTTTRDLKIEQDNLLGLLAGCYQLDARTIGDEQTEWLFHESEDALELVMELQELAEQEKVRVLWPRGKSHDVAGSASSTGFQISVRRDHDWFAASGKLTVNDDLTLDMMKLLDLVADSPSRFVQLDDGRFVALTQELRQRIADIAAFGNPMKNKIRFAPVRALAVDELLEDTNFKADKHWKCYLARIKEAATIESKPPATLQTELRDYQSEGYAWLKRLAHWNTGACLADDMGLGKTIQALALLIDRASDGPALVIAPASVGFNWESETLKFAPTLTPKLFRDCDRNQFFKAIGPGDLVIASYGLLQSESKRFAAVHWSTILLDEAQAIKNMETKRSQAAMQLQGDFKMILTGTPLENHLGELWNLFRFIMPGLLGSNTDFRNRLSIPIERDQCRQSRNRLKKLIQPFLLRRTKTEVLSELPSRSESLLEVELSPAETALYEALRLKAIEKISEAANEDQAMGKKHLQVLAELTRLRLACCHPSLVGGGEIESSKLQLFRHKVTEVVAGKHRALVFSQFVKHLTILREQLDEMGISYQYLDGSTPVKKRKQIVESFQAGEGDVFLISLKAGGTGLNLTAADYVFHMDPWWNPAVEDQATDRAHRIGQRRPVNVYRFITKGTIEEKIVAMHSTKRDLADSLLAGTSTAAKLTTDDLIDLLKENSLEPV